ncbi:MAG: insulinase family protein [Armatimonadetes bacterium]|nr:insulinase family protein [Armatimonadota bacterium]MDW8026781.1 insulinase family protein [Armatimonadota bacterium]
MLRKMLPFTISLAIFSACLALFGGRNQSTFSVLTLAFQSLDIPLPIQLIMANCWQMKLSDKVVGYPWWSFGCFGITFVTERENLESLKEDILRMCKETDLNLLLVRKGKALASQQLKQWKNEPREWLKWNARLAALGSRRILEDEPARISSEEIQRVAKSFFSHDPILISCNSNLWLILPNSSKARASLHSGFRLNLRLSSHSTHGLWWSVTVGEPERAWVLGEFLGGGTGSKWFQILRGDQPLAYHAIAKVEWTPIGAELSLYASALPNDFKVVQKQAKRLISDLKQGQIGQWDFERAKMVAQLRLRQIEADPIALSRSMAIWFMSGRSLSDWNNLSAKLQSLTLENLKSFCRSLPTFSELTVTP